MLAPFDLAVLVVYLVGVVAFGCWFVRKSSNTAEFMVAGGNLAGWAVGLSIFGTFLSSNTFLGVPGKAYGSNWNALVFSFSLPLAAWLAVRFFVPFYRRSGEISAYHHFEHRFGSWARTYGVVCYLLTQLARIGTILFGVSLALALTGWDQRQIILAAGVMITLYTVLGGIEAVIWTDVVQSLVLMGGALVVLGLLLVGMAEGPGQIIEIGRANGKFSLGTLEPDFFVSSFWVVLFYGLFVNLNNFGIDQSFVQRYHTAKSDREAARSVWLGALLYVPISLMFFVIGTSAFGYYQTHPEKLEQVQTEVAEKLLRAEGNEPTPEAVATRVATLTAAEVGDSVLPHFIVHVVPKGLTGLIIAAIFAAAMSSIDTSLNSSATVILSDLYKRYFNPEVSERGSMIVLYTATAAIGAAGTWAAIVMIGIKSVLDVWWLLSGIFAGGLLGLFLLGMLSRRAGPAAALAGVGAGLVVLFWMSWGKLLALFSRQGHAELAERLELPNWLPSPLHESMTIVLGTLTILVVGLVVAQLSPRSESSAAHDSPAPPSGVE